MVRAKCLFEIDNKGKLHGCVQNLKMIEIIHIIEKLTLFYIFLPVRQNIAV